MILVQLEFPSVDVDIQENVPTLSRGEDPRLVRVESAVQHLATATRLPAAALEHFDWDDEWVLHQIVEHLGVVDVALPIVGAGGAQRVRWVE